MTISFDSTVPNPARDDDGAPYDLPVRVYATITRVGPQYHGDGSGYVVEDLAVRTLPSGLRLFAETLDRDTRDGLAHEALILAGV